MIIISISIGMNSKINIITIIYHHHHLVLFIERITKTFHLIFKLFVLFIEEEIIKLG